jgi:hypothetical protein
MSDIPAPMPDFVGTTGAAEQAAMDNPQGDKATPSDVPTQDVAAAQAPPLPKMQRGTQPNLPPPQGTDDLLFGPSSRPMEPPTAGGNILSKPQPPEHLGQYIPALRAATADPSAPPLLHNLLALLAYHLGE